MANTIISFAALLFTALTQVSTAAVHDPIRDAYDQGNLDKSDYYLKGIGGGAAVAGVGLATGGRQLRLPKRRRPHPERPPLRRPPRRLRLPTQPQRRLHRHGRWRTHRRRSRRPDGRPQPNDYAGDTKSRRRPDRQRRRHRHLGKAGDDNGKCEGRDIEFNKSEAGIL